MTDDELTDSQLQSRLSERFAELPEVVQNAIRAADVPAKLRTLADTHKLHLDQWASLENEVMLALLGFQSVDDLPQNIEREVGLDHEGAVSLAADISETVFEPIRIEMEKETQEPQQSAWRPPVAPATPPAPKVERKVERTPISSSYAAQQPSHERKTIEGDPYREPLL